MAYDTIEQALEKEEHIFLQTSGISMEPLLHNRKSTVMIEKAPQQLKKYDVVLFRRMTGEYVLHRVVKVRKNDYLICGDNTLGREPVTRERILGVMRGFYPDESEQFIGCEDQNYRKYVERLEIKYGIRWLQALPGRIYRKLMR